MMLSIELDSLSSSKLKQNPYFKSEKSSTNISIRFEDGIGFSVFIKAGTSIKSDCAPE